jgi:hypothetical protein
MVADGNKATGHRRVPHFPALVVATFVGATILAIVTHAVRYQVLTLVLIAVAVIGLVYSLGAIAKVAAKDDRLAAEWFLEKSQFAPPLHGDFTEFKTALLETLTPDDAALWLTSPHPLLGGASPIDVFLSHGLKAV